MIEDKEFRDLFKIESSEHIQKIEDGLLRLEKEPDNQPVLEEVFREAHSLKGAARMLGLADIENISHRIEDIFGAVRKGEISLTPDVAAKIYIALDAVKKLANEAITGAPAGVDAAKIDESQIPKSKIEDGSFKIETIRVDTKKLDELMTQVGELNIAKMRIINRPFEIDEIINLWHELKRQQLSGKKSMELFERIGVLLGKLKNDAAEDGSKLEFVSDRLTDEAGAIRLLPLSTIFNLFPRVVRDMAKERSKEVEFIIEGGDVTADKRIIEEMKDPVMHMIRNAIDHGIETPEERQKNGKPRTGAMLLKAYQTTSNIVLEIKDDGRGLDIETIKQTALKKKICSKEGLFAMTPAQIQSLIFISGFSTSSFVTEMSGRGVGLDVVRTNIEKLKGTVQIESTHGKGAVFRVNLPITLATVRVLIAKADKMKYAIPVEHVQTSRFVNQNEIFTIEGKKTVILDKQPVSVARLADLLEIRDAQDARQMTHDAFPCIFMSIGNEKLGLLIDELLDEQEIVLKPQSLMLKRVRNVSGAAILGTGEVCMILNPQDLIKSVRKKEKPIIAERPVEEAKRKKMILLAEDSIVTRAQEKRILEGAGYEVVAAVDGMDAWNKLGAQQFDAVVSDILMPTMDGLTLTAKIRQDKRYKEMPVILVTTLASDEDRKKGLEAGANAYIAKPAFDQQALLETLKRLI
ncbi:MAG: hypothetical protein A2073_07695 [Deltaproteobacteria bacterium GWC2_42_11]|nr:MAG: hypothetical protein A2073_07695 [Deltaproteobacteria bacterium GWC2_42_11]